MERSINLEGSLNTLNLADAVITDYCIQFKDNKFTILVNDISITCLNIDNKRKGNPIDIHANPDVAKFVLLQKEDSSLKKLWDEFFNHSYQGFPREIDELDCIIPESQRVKNLLDVEFDFEPNLSQNIPTPIQVDTQFFITHSNTISSASLKKKREFNSSDEEQPKFKEMRLAHQSILLNADSDDEEDIENRKPITEHISPSLNREVKYDVNEVNCSYDTEEYGRNLNEGYTENYEMRLIRKGYMPISNFLAALISSR
ncbi:hypothetical protein ROZALSC1DRAFT_30372 [Rozella allomycis CSF55]|uniref:Uncharacterized protein n=1 Tax=Rozella allomycis (strain CSF55) TaxID=988480 RepID=A0A075AR88_ROZAC|nr:hypothetical protein O9G_005196 [Rozella allomycis CSF55]RKP17868.1 hypothetical protein ROZALSC1DRAFT_30372 [Rozella allomycis CSF55]|eukprot:EPZ31226.1 hypothetical protein O9G_005196 [Rozella allomycis CSF55]